MFQQSAFALTTVPSAITVPGTPIPIPNTSSCFIPLSFRAFSIIPMSSSTRFFVGIFTSYVIFPTRSVISKRSFVPPISTPIQYADFGLNPSIVEGLPTPEGDAQSPYSTRSFFLINSSTIALTVVLLSFSVLEICARLIGCFSLTVFKMSVLLILRISSRCPKLPLFSINLFTLAFN